MIEWNRYNVSGKEKMSGGEVMELANKKLKTREINSKQQIQLKRVVNWELTRETTAHSNAAHVTIIEPGHVED